MDRLNPRYENDDISLSISQEPNEDEEEGDFDEG